MHVYRYRVSVLELLYQMLRETHCLRRRLLVLTDNSGRPLQRLITAAIHLTHTTHTLTEQANNYTDDVVLCVCVCVCYVVCVIIARSFPCQLRMK